jgi:hypothetical protein
MTTTTTRLPADPKTIAEMIPVRQAEMKARKTPRCPLKHGRMVARTLERQTYEVMWCGVWYDCADPRCSTSTTYPSRELAAYHGEAYFTGSGYEKWDGAAWQPITDEQAGREFDARKTERERREAEMRAAARKPRRRHAA